MRRLLKHFTTFVVAIGLSSVVFGFLYGSIFGYEHVIHPVWMSPLSDPMRMLTLALYWGVGFIIRVCRNVGVEVLGYVGTLSEFPRKGYFENTVYHKDKRIRVNLYCAWCEGEDEPMLLVSNQRCNLLLLYRQRMKRSATSKVCLVLVV